MAEVALNLLWHQHQPYYPDDVAGENPMPWVRLHGVKDYYGMALHLQEMPEIRCCINLVPSLLKQLRAYTDENASDRYLDLSRVDPDSLTEDEVYFLLDHFFMANPETMIPVHPRFADLHQRRGFGRDDARTARKRFTTNDLRDLQVWFNLVWVHPLAVEHDELLQFLVNKGRNYTEEEKQDLLDKHLEILRRIIPLHRELAERGQVELTTTPMYHPILPLLIDKKLAREAIPEVDLPRASMGYPEDAEIHVRRALEYHSEVFGAPPRGMWPAEGSVCQALIPLLSRLGVEWVATDEGVLTASTQGQIGRDPNGKILHPERMYRTYKVRQGDDELGIVFRDHSLSDSIGFRYKKSDPEAAAEHFLAELNDIGQSVPPDRPAVVTVILDGENCWEHYPNGGVPFLRTLYRRLAEAPNIRTTTIGESLQRYPPTDTLPHLFAGSWINHNFSIWIGHSEDNEGWDALHNTREFLLRKAGSIQDPVEEAKLKQAWEELYIAEGSDWFWWYGDDHWSAQDAMFDYLFRKHLQNVYVLLNELPPLELSRPIKRRGERIHYTVPKTFHDIHIDGNFSFLEWFGAGLYECRNVQGAMSQATRGPLRELHFTFNLDDLLIRIDSEESASATFATCEMIRVVFLMPRGYEVRIHQPAQPEQWVELVSPNRTRRVDPDQYVEVGLDKVVELAVAFEWLQLEEERPFEFFVEVTREGQILDRAPPEGGIALVRPSPDYEQIMWDV